MLTAKGELTTNVLVPTRITTHNNERFKLVACGDNHCLAVSNEGNTYQPTHKRKKNLNLQDSICC